MGRAFGGALSRSGRSSRCRGRPRRVHAPSAATPVSPQHVPTPFLITLQPGREGKGSPDLYLKRNERRFLLQHGEVFSPITRRLCAKPESLRCLIHRPITVHDDLTMTGSYYQTLTSCCIRAREPKVSSEAGAALGTGRGLQAVGDHQVSSSASLSLYGGGGLLGS